MDYKALRKNGQFGADLKWLIIQNVYSKLAQKIFKYQLHEMKAEIRHICGLSGLCNLRPNSLNVILGTTVEICRGAKNEIKRFFSSIPLT